METEFVEIVRKLVAVKRDRDTLFDTKLCRAALADLTRNKYKRERNLLLQAVESGAAMAIDDASGNDLQICKLQQIRKLHEDYSLDSSAAEEVVNMLALILRGDNSETVIKPIQKIANTMPDNTSKTSQPTIVLNNSTPDPPQPPKRQIWKVLVGILSIIAAIFILYSLIVTKKADVNIEMILVRGGTFMMGCTPEQGGECDDSEKPAHEVTLSDYYIGKYPVTQAQWKAVMGNNNPSYFKGDDLPVEQVTWNDAQEFIKKLNQNTGKNYRLPTEAEWEYAARGGIQSRGYKYSGSDDLEDVAFYRDNSGDKTHPVGTKKANELGIYDMTGNVWEWVNDRYGGYGTGSQTNPKGTTSGSDRVFRGGGWDSYRAGGTRVSFRFFYGTSIRNNNLGFRLASSSK